MKNKNSFLALFSEAKPTADTLPLNSLICVSTKLVQQFLWKRSCETPGIFRSFFNFHPRLQYISMVRGRTSKSLSKIHIF